MPIVRAIDSASGPRGSALSRSPSFRGPRRHAAATRFSLDQASVAGKLICHGPYRVNHVLRSKGLRKDGVSPRNSRGRQIRFRLDRMRLVFRRAEISTSGNRDDPDVREFPHYGPYRVHAVYLRHNDVHDDDVDRLCPECLEPFDAVVGHLHRVTRAHQRTLGTPIALYLWQTRKFSASTA